MTTTLGIRDQRNEEAYGLEAQLNIANSVVGLVGTGSLAQFTAACLAGVGVRTLRIVGHERITGKEREPLLLERTRGQPKIKEIKKTLEKINEDADIFASAMSFQEWDMYPFRPQILIDATNDPSSKKTLF